MADFAANGHRFLRHGFAGIASGVAVEHGEIIQIVQVGLEN